MSETRANFIRGWIIGLAAMAALFATVYFDQFASPSPPKEVTSE